MSDIDEIATDVLKLVNAVALGLFLILFGTTLASMLRRVGRYRRAEAVLPVILKRGLVLFIALTILGGESAILRASGVDLADYPVARLIYTLQADAILLIALAYFAKTDLYDIDNPEVP